MNKAGDVPYTVQQDEDGVWCAHARLRPGVGAHGEGDSSAAAVADMQEALIGLIAEFSRPEAVQGGISTLAVASSWDDTIQRPMLDRQVP